MKRITRRMEKAQADRAEREARAKAVEERGEQFAAEIAVNNTQAIFGALERHKAEHGTADMDFTTVSVSLSVFASLLIQNRLLPNNPSVSFFVEAARVGVARAAAAARKRSEEKRIVTL